MKITKGVRGTMDTVPSIEVNVDTVYVRSNIKRIEEPDFSGWEYDELQYDKDNYIERIAGENKQLKQDLTASNMETLQMVSMIDQMNKQDQSEMMMEIMTLIAELQGGV